MPKHKPIRFNDPTASEEIKKLVLNYAAKHPVATNAAKVILATALTGGLLTTLAVAPGLGMLLGKMARSTKRERQERYRKLWESFYNLRKRNLLEFVGENEDGELVYNLTEKGRKESRKFLIETLELKEPIKWDKKWRVVIFDVPEKFKRRRRTFQEKLREIGFYQLQKSVLIHPFPCEAEVEFLKDFLEIGRYVELFTTPDMPNGRVVYSFKDLLADYL